MALGAAQDAGAGAGAARRRGADWRGNGDGFLGAVGLAKAMSAITSEFADAFTVGTNDPRC